MKKLGYALVLFFIAASPAFAAAPSFNNFQSPLFGSIIDTNNPSVTFSGVVGECNAVNIRCAVYPNYFYTSCYNYTIPTPVPCDSLSGAINWLQVVGGDVNRLERPNGSAAIGMYFYNADGGIYTGSSMWQFVPPPTPTPSPTAKYMMNANVSSAGGQLLGAQVGTLFQMIVTGVGIVGGAVTTLFGLRFLIKTVRGNLHG
jgi:hypothetical protein